LSRVLEELKTFIQIITEQNECNAFALGIIEKTDASEIRFTRNFAQLSGMAVRDPLTWLNEKPDHILECTFSIQSPTQTWVIAAEIFKGESRLFFTEVQKKGLVIYLTSKNKDHAILIFELEKMPSTWTLLQDKITILSGWSEELLEKAQVFRTKYEIFSNIFNVR
jgi:hypothetical protein